MDNFKYFGIGVALFGLITLIVLAFEFVTTNLLGMNNEQVGVTLMILALLIIAKPCGELSVSVFNNTFLKK